MIAINIPPKIRFGLYLAATLLIQVVGYLTDKSWVGPAEVNFAGDLASLMLVLAAAKTDLTAGADTRPVQRVQGH